jgi:hypothetical protein
LELLPVSTSDESAPVARGRVRIEERGADCTGAMKLFRRVPVERGITHEDAEGAGHHAAVGELLAIMKACWNCLLLVPITGDVRIG